MTQVMKKNYVSHFATVTLHLLTNETLHSVNYQKCLQ